MKIFDCAFSKNLRQRKMTVIHHEHVILMGDLNRPLETPRPSFGTKLLLLTLEGSAVCGPCQTEGPASPSVQPAWLATLKKERDSVLANINYTGGVFANPSLAWTQASYIQPQVHPYDRFFFDEVSGN